MAPPTIAVDKIPEALVVCEPKPSTDKEKMTASMIELQSPTAIIECKRRNNSHQYLRPDGCSIK